MEVLFAIMFQLVWNTPLFIVWGVGLALAISRRADHPRRYTLVAIAMSLFMLISLLSSMTSVYIPFTAVQSGLSSTEVGVNLAIFNGAYTIMSVIAWICLLVALFSRRESA
ncbi:MAG: hypothetical protein MUD01_24695 [Chloroflexaceae bacterium]|jgi:hypothetical protein|nr:hypothetical protein [Chloroflexaceae bacterium]